MSKTQENYCIDCLRPDLSENYKKILTDFISKLEKINNDLIYEKRFESDYLAQMLNLKIKKYKEVLNNGNF